MRWLTRGKGFAKRPSPKDEALDVTMDTTKDEANAALAIARDNEAKRARGEAKQVEQRIVLTEMAARLRIALFDEIFCPTERAPPVSCSGSDILHKLISLGFATTPEDAVLLANRLVLVGALNGTEGPCTFIASDSCRYRFAVDRYAHLASGQESDQLVDGTRVEGAMGGTSSRMVAELAQSLQHPTLGVRKSVDGQGRVGFSGTDVVHWLMNNDIAGTRQDAVCIASALVRGGVFFADHRNFVHGETRYILSEDSFTAAASAALRN